MSSYHVLLVSNCTSVLDCSQVPVMFHRFSWPVTASSHSPKASFGRCSAFGDSCSQASPDGVDCSHPSSISFFVGHHRSIYFGRNSSIFISQSQLQLLRVPCSPNVAASMEYFQHLPVKKASHFALVDARLLLMLPGVSEFKHPLNESSVGRSMK